MNFYYSNKIVHGHKPRILSKTIIITQELDLDFDLKGRSYPFFEKVEALVS